jgi:hypothetical protein
MMLPEPLQAQIQYKDPYVTLAGGDQVRPVIAKPSQEDYVVIVWEDDRSHGIYAQMIETETGLPLWDPIDGVAVCTENGLQRNPKAAYDSLGGVIIVWEDFRSRHNSPVTDTTVSEIYAHRIILSTGMLDANWSGAPDGVPVCTGTDANARDVCIVGTTDGAYISWTDYRNSAGYPSYANKDVYVQYLLSATGSYRPGYNWVQNGVRIAWADPYGNEQQTPDITLDYVRRTGLHAYGALVVYEDSRNDAWQVFANNIGADGSDLWQMDLSVAPYAYSSFDHQWEPKIAATGVPGNAHLDAVVTWRDERDNNLQTGDIYAQRISHTGARLWALSGLPVCTAAEEQKRQRIAAKGNYAMITWEDKRDSLVTDIDVYGNIIDVFNGTLYWPAATAGKLCDEAGRQSRPEVDVDGTKFVVAWQDARPAMDADMGVPSGIDIFGHQLSPGTQGLFRWPGNGQAISRAKHDQVRPQVSRDVIVWQDGRRRPVSPSQLDQRIDENIFAQRLGDECDLPTEMRWRERYVKWTWGTEMRDHRFVLDRMGNTYAVWLEDRPEYGGVPAVFAQKLDRDGVPKWYNDGVLLSAPGEACEEPDICIDDEEGAFVAWRQDADEIHLARIDYEGNPIIEIIDPPGGYAPRLVEDDAGGVHLVYSQTDRLKGRRYDANLNLVADAEYGPQQTAPPPPYSAVKLSKDREGGTWVVWQNGEDYYGTLWDGASFKPHGDLLSAYGGTWTSITGDFDLDTDYFPLERTSLKKNLYDGIVTATVEPGLGPVDEVVIARLYHDNTDVAKFDGIGNVSINTNRTTHGHSHMARASAVSADSLPSPFEYMELGGAIVSWTNWYFDDRLQEYRYCVLTNRVFWEERSGAFIPYYHFVRTDEPVIDFEVVLEPVSDIAAMFNQDPYGPDEPRFGVVTWTTDRPVGCASPLALRAQMVDYTIPNNPPAEEPRLWTTAGSNVAPLHSSLAQTAPMVKSPPPGNEGFRPYSVPIFWADTRTVSTSLMATWVRDLGGVMNWNKPPRQEDTPVTVQGFDIGSPYPNPLSLSMHGRLQLPVHAENAGTVRITLFDALGRRIGASRTVDIDSGAATLGLDLRTFGTLRPGVYFCGIETAEGLQTRRLILLR